MFVAKLDGNRLNHPFWKTAFHIETHKDIDTILDPGISHVWIDTDKGKDVAPVDAPKAEVIAPAPAAAPTFEAEV